MEKLHSQQLAQALVGLPQWCYDNARGAITREFLFQTFPQAFAFMAQLAIVAEQRNHHPEWFNVYNRVLITLTTHDADGLTQQDLDWATYADAAYARFAEIA
ncbi:4a-hydroxytetrahydrobiopterin dehydratase [Crenobacter sp. SG2303]|uniref:Putative pterin-4-alpha-carbinolamine dehydratase n=1 Tax=Crenobacter oryzisoli TaxID=3056844 RepID=A0ABT7XTC0_9NEIS|nr:4a-hydroxytetrahydrobiopterin dehydratase [Crenobacter sp. SG2303]MDN0077032.1 4a-hydroxytetrahydrobiopterin dehydratase [Crenobacter sp. SG2303]